MGKKILFEKSEPTPEELEAIEKENALIRKKNNRAVAIILLIPIFVSVVGYFYIILFWSQDRLIFDALPQFMQDFGAISKVVQIFEEENRFNIANNYTINYYFGLLYIITLTLIAIRYDFFTREKNLSKNIPLWAFLLIILFLYFFISSIFFSDVGFKKELRMTWVMRIELFGMAFYSMMIGLISCFTIIFVFGIKFNTKGAANVR